MKLVSYFYKYEKQSVDLKLKLSAKIKLRPFNKKDSSFKAWDLKCMEDKGQVYKTYLESAK